MRHAVSTLSLLAALLGGTGSVEAGLLYRWEGSCTTRYHNISGVALVDLGCPAKAAGFIEAPDGYVPGTSYYFYNDYPPLSQRPVFTLSDSFFGSKGFRSEMFGSGAITLPVANEPGPWGWAWQNPNLLSYGLSGGDWLFSTELAIGENYLIRGAQLQIFRVGEPSTLLLLLTLPAGAVAWLSRSRT